VNDLKKVMKKYHGYYNTYHEQYFKTMNSISKFNPNKTSNKNNKIIKLFLPIIKWI